MATSLEIATYRVYVHIIYQKMFIFREKRIQAETMKEIKDKVWLQQWKRHRRNMTWISYFLILMYGFEILSVAVTMVYYLSLSFSMDNNKASMYSCIIETFCGIGQLCGGMVFGRYLDRTRNLRFVVLANLVSIIVGNLLYSMPFHVGFLMVGRFLCGLNESLQTAFCGKIWYKLTISKKSTFSKSYEKNRLFREVLTNLLLKISF